MNKEINFGATPNVAPNYKPHTPTMSRIRTEEDREKWMKNYGDLVYGLLSDKCKAAYQSKKTEKEKYKYLQKYYRIFVDQGLLIDDSKDNDRETSENLIRSTTPLFINLLLRGNMDYYDTPKDVLIEVKKELKHQVESVDEMLDFLTEIEQENRRNVAEHIKNNKTAKKPNIHNSHNYNSSCLEIYEIENLGKFTIARKVQSMIVDGAFRNSDNSKLLCRSQKAYKGDVMIFEPLNSNHSFAYMTKTKVDDTFVVKKYPREIMQMYFLLWSVQNQYFRKTQRYNNLFLILSSFEKFTKWANTHNGEDFKKIICEARKCLSYLDNDNIEEAKEFLNYWEMID